MNEPTDSYPDDVLSEPPSVDRASSRRPRRRNLLLNSGLAVVLVAAGVVGVRALSDDGGTADAATTRTVDVQQIDLVRSVTASGQIASWSTASSDFPSAASDSTVTAIDVKVGDQVTRGQVLAQVDGTALDLAERSAEADLAAAEAALESAEDAAASATSSTGATGATAAVGSSAASSTPGSATSVDQAEIAVDQAEIALEQARSATADATLTATIDGTVTAVNGTVGATAAGSTSTSDTAAADSAATAPNAGAATGSTGSTGSSDSGSGFIVIANMKALMVSTSVAEADIDSVQVGQAATVTLSATGSTHDAVVSSVDPNPTTANGVVSYGVDVVLTDPTDGIRLGATADVSITVESAPDALVVPAAAISSSGGGDTVMVRTGDGTDERRTVQTGIEGAQGVQVTSGLAVGDRVVITVTTPTGSDSSETDNSTGGRLGGLTGGGGGFPAGGPPAGFGG